MTAQQVADRWGCSVRTVNRMAQSRQVSALKRGRHWRFPTDAVDAYERAHTAAPTSAQYGGAEGQQACLTGLTAVPDLPPDYEPVFPELWGLSAAAPVSPTGGRGRSARNMKRRQSDAI